MEDAQLPAHRCKRQPHRQLLGFVALLAGVRSLSAQGTLPVPQVSPGKFPLCRSEQLAAAKRLTFGQQACWYGSELVSPWAAVRAAFVSGIGQWQNKPYVEGQNADDYAHRFAAYYAMRSARLSGELIAGYFNHEDPRFHPSEQATYKKRLKRALFSVLVMKGDEGSRPALGPILGSLGSGFTGAAMYRDHTGTEYALRSAALCYGGYFGKALYEEFRPDISSFVKRMRHKKQD